MSWILALALALALPAQTTRPVDLKNLPKDWPPLPDFKHTVDYVKWLEKRVNEGLTDDASALWAALRADEERRPELWGWDGDNGVAGLFTGSEPTPHRYAWDPAEHPDWEKAYQSQERNGFRQRMIEVSRRRCLIYRGGRSDLSLTDEKGQAVFGPGDCLLFTQLFPSLATQRYAGNILLQNAWRAPEGKVDASAFVDALETAFGIAKQLEGNRLGGIAMLTSTGLHMSAYHNALKALSEEVLDEQSIAQLVQWLARNDDHRLDRWSQDVSYVAILCDLLQFAYLPEDEVWRQPLRPNRRNIQKLAELLKHWNKGIARTAGLQTQPADLTGQIDRCAPKAGAQQIATYFLQCRDVREQRLPWQAESECSALLRQLQQDAATHVVVRRFMPLFPSNHLRGIRCEADRRATRIVLALHRTHAQTGHWPVSLDSITPPLPAPILIDPFSGKPFIYRLENGEPRLYSAGYNARDDGGKHLPYNKQEEDRDGTSVAVEADYVYWPVQKEK